MTTQNENSDLERRFVGVVEVDSGTLLLGDPGYCLPRRETATDGIDYQAVIDAPDEVAAYLADEPVLLLGRFGGDGSYPVFADLDSDGSVLRFIVEFVEPEDAAEGSPGGVEARA